MTGTAASGAGRDGTLEKLADAGEELLGKPAGEEAPAGKEEVRDRLARARPSSEERPLGVSGGGEAQSQERARRHGAPEKAAGADRREEPALAIERLQAMLAGGVPLGRLLQEAEDADAPPPGGPPRPAEGKGLAGGRTTRAGRAGTLEGIGFYSLVLPRDACRILLRAAVPGPGGEVAPGARGRVEPPDGPVDAYLLALDDLEFATFHACAAAVGSVRASGAEEIARVRPLVEQRLADGPRQPAAPEDRAAGLAMGAGPPGSGVKEGPPAAPATPPRKRFVIQILVKE